MAKGSLIFSSPTWLWLLPFLMVGGFVLWQMARKLARDRISRFVAARFVEEAMATVNWRGLRIRYWLVALILALLLGAAARPLLGPKPGTVDKEGVDIVIALDVSKSMNVEDILPNRLAAVKKALSAWFGELNGDRIGLVFFAGEAAVQAPLTSDYAALDQVLQLANQRAISSGGTNIPKAIEVATKMLEKRQDGMKAIVLVTDGENFQSDAIAAARTAKTSKNISIFTVGVGSPQGGKVPSDDYSQPDKKKERHYVSSGVGTDAYSKLDERSLRAMADAGGGAYYLFDPELRTFGLLKEQSLMPLATRGRTVKVMDYQEMFQIPLGLAILLLVIEPLISTTRKRPVVKAEGDGRPPREMRPIRTAVIVGLLALPGMVEANPEPLKEQVEALLKAEKKEDAVMLMQAAVSRNEQDHFLLYNYGLVLFRAGKFDEAARTFQFVESLATDQSLKARAAKQVGNAYYRSAEQLKKNPNYLHQVAMLLEQSLGQYAKVEAASPSRELTVNREAAKAMLEEVLLAMADRRMKNAEAFSVDPKNLPRKEEQLKDAVQIYERLAELKPKEKALQDTKEAVKEELAKTQVEVARLVAKIADEMAANKMKPTYIISRRQEALDRYEAALQNKVKDPKVADEKQELLEKMSDQWLEIAKERTDKVLPMAEIGEGGVKLLKEARKFIEKAQALTPESPKVMELASRVSDKLEKHFEKQGDKALVEADKQQTMAKKLEQTQNASDNFQKALAENVGNDEIQDKLKKTNEKLPEMLAKVADDSVAKAEELTGQPDDVARLREAIGHLEKATQSYDLALSLKPEQDALKEGRDKADRLLAESRKEIQKLSPQGPLTAEPNAKEEMEENKVGPLPDGPKMRDAATVRKKPSGQAKTEDSIWERSFKDW